MMFQSKEKPKYADKEPESLTEVREMVNRLMERGDDPIPFPPRMGPQNATFRRHKVGCGSSIEYPLYEDEDTTCGLFFHSAQTEFPNHSHNQREWLIVIRGSLIFQTKKDGEWEAAERILTGQSRVIEADVIHRANTIEDTWYYAITIPKADR